MPAVAPNNLLILRLSGTGGHGLDNLPLTGRWLWNSPAQIGTGFYAVAAGTFSASGPHKVYVAAIAPAGIAGRAAGLYLLEANGGWSYYSGGPLREYVSNATLDQTQHYFVSILDAVDLSGPIGTRILVGYGTDDQEMLTAQRYREVYVVQPDIAQ